MCSRCDNELTKNCEKVKFFHFRDEYRAVKITERAGTLKQHNGFDNFGMLLVTCCDRISIAISLFVVDFCKLHNGFDRFGAIWPEVE